MLVFAKKKNIFRNWGKKKIGHQLRTVVSPAVFTYMKTRWVSLRLIMHVPCNLPKSDGSQAAGDVTGRSLNIFGVMDDISLGVWKSNKSLLFRREASVVNLDKVTQWQKTTLPIRSVLLCSECERIFDAYLYHWTLCIALSFFLPAQNISTWQIIQNI